jgi:hypothetical protein
MFKFEFKSTYANPLIYKSRRNFASQTEPSPVYIPPKAINPISESQQSILTKGDYKSSKKKIPKLISKLHLIDSTKLVKLAITSNLVMFSAKSYGAIQSGSASMFAESMHSLADVVNGSLLLWGLMRSLKKADLTHPYGYLNEKYAWALVSGVGVMFLGGGVTLYHGINGIINGSVLYDIDTALIALGGCMIFESATLSLAFIHIKKLARYYILTKAIKESAFMII